jgi:hypothetical protein
MDVDDPEVADDIDKIDDGDKMDDSSSDDTPKLEEWGEPIRRYKAPCYEDIYL